MATTSKKVQVFRRVVWSYYRAHGRDLPWRNTRDPWKIVVSEVMLQQTQVARVLPKYRLFLKRFPTPAALAAAPLREVLAAWQGLGYNRRAIGLQWAAKAILADHKGKVPRDAAALEALPAIGRYTASAIRIFAFNAADACIETNIRRAAIHHFFPRSKNVSDQKLLPLLLAALDARRSREWHWALMDYGAMLGTSLRESNPNRKSASYKKQPAFRGSRRELRGIIIRTLLQKKKLPLRELVRISQRPAAECLEALRAIEAENIVVLHKASASLKSGL